jgi:(d)CTP diphosphatase
MRKDVVGALILQDGKILLAQRSCSDLDGKWEFPGGKVETGESNEEALVREILEELGVDVTVTARAASNDFSVGQKLYSLHCYWCEIVSGEPLSNEHHSLVWVGGDELLSFDLAPADIPVAKEIVKHDW